MRTIQNQHKYRRNTHAMTPYNWSMRYCKGCRRNRSAGQFMKASEYCLKCS